ncbi:MAG TPA: MBL fold metallo-hydrolase [Myxococcota bacterium]|nr:MBL fold metallo-hydrolase [Myxococcota bacterium]HQK52492.1 MBL fold metallo-hydrolase [Myxococcota bacterium]
MNIRILGGAHEIGGNCVELESGGARLLLDLGRPLSAAPDDDVPLPPVAGLDTGDDPDLLGIVISHGHLDHYGLLERAHPDVPVFMGEAAARILAEAAFFLRNPLVPRPTGFLQDGVPLDISPFRVTPWLVDHSAFDAYALEVEAGGQRLFYTGDLRGHGRKASLFQRLLVKPPRDIDVLLAEATNVRDSDAPPTPIWTEEVIEQRFVEAFRATSGLALVAFSVQNIDRLVTLYRAARRADRELVVDLYAATVARATGHANIPQPPGVGPSFDHYRVFVPLHQRLRVKEQEEFDRVNWIRDVRLFPKELAANPNRFVMLFRGSMICDLRHLAKLPGPGLAGARAWWSLWKGYLEQPAGLRLRTDLDGLGIPLDVIHTSGHASVEDLRRLAQAINAREVIYLHTEHPDAAKGIAVNPRD